MQKENEVEVSIIDSADELVRFGVSMPGSLAREFEAWRTKHGYPSRSPASRWTEAAYPIRQ